MRSRRGLGVLAVCGLVLGLMAISASGAQAGKWMVNKANVGATELKAEAGIEIEALPGTSEKHLVLLTTSGANKVELLCGVVNNASVIFVGNKIKGNVNINSCTTNINGKPEKNCDPLNQPIKAAGEAEAVLHEGKAYAKAEGEGGVFATLKFNEETCLALSPSIKITGVGWLEDCNNEFEVEKTTHLLQEGKVPAEKLGGLFFGSNKAVIHGSIVVSFVDAAHKGLTFSGLAE